MFIVDASLKCNFEDRSEGPCVYCYNTLLRRKFQNQKITNVKAIESTLKREYSKRPGSIILHGGEPLYMDEKDLKRLLKISYELSGRSALQTNGSLVDETKIKIFKKYKTHVGVSIDGYWPANRWRGKSKRNTDLVIDNIFKLKKAGIHTAVLITLHKDNANPEKIKYVENLLLDLARKGIYSKVNLIYHHNPQIELTPQEAKKAYLRLAEFVLDHNLPQINPFQSIVNNLLGKRSECMFRECDPYCTSATHITADGVPTICGRFQTETFYRGEYPTSIRWNILRQTDCKNCPYGGKVCFGGCPAIAKDWDWRNKDRFCEAYFALFEFFERKLKALIPSLPLKTDSRSKLSSSIPSSRVEKPAFSRIVWRENYQKNSQIFQRWAEEFNRAEVLTVVHKLRNCGIYLMDAQKYQEESFNLTKMGIVFLPLKKVEEPPDFRESHLIQGVVSYSEEKAQTLAECLQFGGIDCVTKIGQLLGYPSCCTTFLRDYSIKKKVVDPIFMAAQRTKGATITNKKDAVGIKNDFQTIKAKTISIPSLPELNVIFRNFGVKAIPHIPCSFTCKKSQEFSKIFLKFMPSKNSLLKFLAEPTLWDEYKGIAVIDSKWFQGVTPSVFRRSNFHHLLNFRSQQSTFLENKEEARVLRS